MNVRKLPNSTILELLINVRKQLINVGDLSLRQTTSASAIRSGSLARNLSSTYLVTRATAFVSALPWVHAKKTL